MDVNQIMFYLRKLAVIALPQKATNWNDKLIRVSERLALLQKALFELCGIETIYIGAGSSISLLDHCVYGDEIAMRDLDIFACLDAEVTREFAFELGQKLQQYDEDLGIFSEHDVRPRRRGNPGLTGDDSQNYNAGFGLFLIDSEDELLDLTLFHSRDDMLLNGILDVDRIRIPLTPTERLADKLQPIKRHDPSSVRFAGIEDEHGGYDNWTQRSARVVNRFDVFRAPLLTSIRIIRSFAKHGQPALPDPALNLMSEAVSTTEPSQSFHVLRGVIKMLSDDNGLSQLEVFRAVGGIEKVELSLRKHLSHVISVIDKFGVAAREARKVVKETVGILKEEEHRWKLSGVN
jgi:hypothetical protein